MLFIHYPRCSTCQRALHFLEHRGIHPEVRDIRTESPTAAELLDWQKRSGIEWKRLYNTSGNVYRERKLKEIVPTLSPEEHAELLASDGMLVKRPLLIDGDRLLAGFREAAYLEFIEQSVSDQPTA